LEGSAGLYSSMRVTKESMSSQRRIPNSPRTKRERQVKSKVKSMLIIFSDIKGIDHKEFVLADQANISAYYRNVLQ
jgi:hypothetical protein